MKKIEFKTSKGEFVLVDLPEDATVQNSYCESVLYTLADGTVETEYPIDFNGELTVLGKLSEMTEEQASDVVDERELCIWQKNQNFHQYYDYTSKSESGICCVETSIDSLHSLLKSKGVYLFENPYEPYWRTSDYMFAEQNTFYNPYLFKKI